MNTRVFVTSFFSLVVVFSSIAQAQQPLCVIVEHSPLTQWVASNPNGPWVPTSVYAPGNSIKADGEWELINNWVNPVTGNWEARLYRCFINASGNTVALLWDSDDHHPTLGPLGGGQINNLVVQTNVPAGESGVFYYRVDFALYFSWFDPNYYDEETGQIGREVVLGPPLAQSVGETRYFHQPGYGPPAGQ